MGESEVILDMGDGEWGSGTQKVHEQERRG